MKMTDIELAILRLSKANDYAARVYQAAGEDESADTVRDAAIMVTDACQNALDKLRKIKELS